MFFLGKVWFYKILNYKIIFASYLETKKALHMHETDQQNFDVHDVWDKCTGIARSLFRQRVLLQDPGGDSNTIKAGLGSVQNNDHP